MMMTTTTTTTREARSSRVYSRVYSLERGLGPRGWTPSSSSRTARRVRRLTSSDGAHPRRVARHRAAARETEVCCFFGDGDVDERAIRAGGSFVASFVVLDRSVAMRASSSRVVARGDARIGVDVDDGDEWWHLER